jgi:hypothetical protein
MTAMMPGDREPPGGSSLFHRLMSLKSGFEDLQDANILLRSTFSRLEERLEALTQTVSNESVLQLMTLLSERDERISELERKLIEFERGSLYVDQERSSPVTVPAPIVSKPAESRGLRRLNTTQTPLCQQEPVDIPDLSQT